MIEHSTGILILLFFTSALLVGALVNHFLQKTNIPYTVGLLAVGLLGGFSIRTFLQDSPEHLLSHTTHLIGEMDPHLILFVFLPILIFESAYALETHLFRRIFSQIVTLAVPGLIACTLLTALFAKYVLPWDWSWSVCLMFGALISATDPVAVVALLKEVSSRKRLETLIEGESLLNDGTAIVFFTIFYVMVTGSGASFSLSQVSFEFIRVVSGGLVVGTLIGGIAVFWWGRVFNQPMIEISITVMAAYLSFIIAEHFLHFSGVVAVVSTAIMLASIGRTRISPEVGETMHHFWEMMSFIANTVIFLLVGVVIASRLNVTDPELWLMLAVMYLGVMVIRAAVIFLFMPLLKIIGIGFNFQKAIVLIWGGLRGAVALALALAVAQDERIATQIGGQILFLCAGVVVLTIVINGTLMLPVLKLLGLDRLPPAKEVSVKKATVKVRHALQKFLPELQKDEFLQEANWKKVKKNTSLDESVDMQTLIQKEYGKVSDHELAVACRRRLLETERKNYWTQFDEGYIGITAANKLNHAVETALDGEPTITPRSSLMKLWDVPRALTWFQHVPVLNRLALKYSFVRMAIGYDVARAFIHAQDEMLSYLQTLAPSEEIEGEIRVEIEQNKQDTYAKIALLRLTFPEILKNLETYAASRAMLNRERSVIHDLIEAGVIDAAEAKWLIKDVEARMQHLSYETERISMEHVLALLHQTKVVEGLSEVCIQKLTYIMEEHIYSDGQVIIQQEKLQGGLIFVIRGTVEVITLKDQRQTVRHLGPGAWIGIEDLLGQPFTEKVIAHMPVEIMWLPGEKLARLLNTESRLVENLQNMI